MSGKLHVLIAGGGLSGLGAEPILHGLLEALSACPAWSAS